MTMITPPTPSNHQETLATAALMLEDFFSHIEKSGYHNVSATMHVANILISSISDIIDVTPSNEANLLRDDLCSSANELKLAFNGLHPTINAFSRASTQGVFTFFSSVEGDSSSNQDIAKTPEDQRTTFVNSTT